MKNPERVAELIAELRELADNDFERHRIDVLERDLTAPPIVEVIDDTHQRFNGVVYHKNKNGTHNKYASIHHDVWVYYNGKIPEGDYQIHHVDHNPANNNIFNLQLLTTTEHQRLHRTKPLVERICPICGKKFIVSRKYFKQKYCSRSCAYKYISLLFKKPHTERICPTCGEKFTVPHQNRNQIYCSRACYIAKAK